jgi:glyoxylase-like metal-dependent hydrolase (beta-lactamase superfamily II)
MQVRSDRRRFLLGSAALAVTGTLAAASGSRAHAARPRLITASLAPGVELIRGPGGNSVAIDTPEGVALVDGGLKADSRDLLKRVEAGGRRVATLFNTHWHPHVTGCNEALGKAGVRIVAQENTRLWLQRPIVKVLENERHDPLPKAAWPNASFLESQQFSLGGTLLDCGRLFQAHTDGDMYVRLPAANLIITGGTVAVGHYPILDTFTGGWIRGMLNATKALIELSDEKTQIVAESGPVVGRAHLVAQAEMLETLTERLWQLMRKGLSEEDLVAAQPTKDYDAQWGDPRSFILNTYRGIWGHVREMRGIV